MDKQGIFGSIVLGIVLLITLQQTCSHVQKLGWKPKIVLHCVLLLAVTLDFVYFISFILFSTKYYDYVDGSFKYFWISHIYAVFLNFFAILWFSKTWFNTSTNKDTNDSNATTTEQTSTFSLLKHVKSCSVAEMFLWALFITAFIVNGVLATKAIRTSNYVELKAVVNGFLSCSVAIAAVVFAVILSFTLLYSGMNLQKSLPSNNCQALNEPLYESKGNEVVVQGNIALGVIVSGTLLRASVYVLWVVFDSTYWASTGAIFLYYVVDTIIPGFVLTLSLLWLSRARVGHPRLGRNLV